VFPASCFLLRVSCFVFPASCFTLYTTLQGAISFALFSVLALIPTRTLPASLAYPSMLDSMLPHNDPCFSIAFPFTAFPLPSFLLLSYYPPFYCFPTTLPFTLSLLPSFLLLSYRLPIASPLLPRPSSMLQYPTPCQSPDLILPDGDPAA